MTRQQQASQHQGWLWRRLGPSSSPRWERFWARAGRRLSLFADEKEEELTESLPLGQLTVTEVPLPSRDGTAAGGTLHTRGLQLRPAGAGAGGTPRSGSAAAPWGDMLLAAEDAAQHAAWLKRLGRSCAGCGKAGEEGSGEAKQARAYSTGIRSPPLEVVQRLCGPGLVQGRRLMEQLRQSRWQLEAGLRDLSMVREEARSAQRPLHALHATLLDMGRAVGAHHGSVALEADRRALRQCEDWLQGAVTFVMEVDAQLEALVFSDATLNVAAEWVALAQNTIAQLRDIEDVMRAEELRQLQLRGAPAAAGSASGGSCRARVASAPAMPYSRWWANKVAL